MAETLEDFGLTRAERLTSLSPWPEMTLKDVLSDIKSGFACGRKVIDDGIVHLRMDNIGTNGRLDLGRITRVNYDKRKAEKWLLKPGDVLFNNTNSRELVGKSALFSIQDKDYYYSNHLSRLRVRQDVVIPEWLVLCLRRLWQKRFFERICIQWVSQSAVHSRKLKLAKIPVPPKDEQVRIAAKVESIEARVRETSRLMEETRNEIETVAASVVQKALTGSL
jgi:type I restriction enzyme S subunit